MKSDQSHIMLARRSWQHIFLICVIALALRSLAVRYYHEVPACDAAEYHGLAQNVVKGGVYGEVPDKPSAFRSCGYPLFLSAIYHAVGVNWYVAEYVQAVLGCGSVLLVIALAWCVVGRREALLAGYLAAIYPAFVWLPRRLLSENLSLFLQLLALCVVALFVRRPNAIRASSLGIVLGLNLLTRGATVFLTILIISGAAVTAGGHALSRKGITLAAITAITAAVTLAPWVLRNYVLLHQFVPIATEGGITMYISYWPIQNGGKTIWGNVPGDEDPVVAASHGAGNEAMISRYFSDLTLRRLSEDPAHAFRLIPVKMLNLVVPIDWEVFPHAAGSSRSVNYGYLVAILPAMVGCWSLYSRRVPHDWVLWTAPVSALLLAIIFYGSPRFRLPAEPILLIFASAGLVFLWNLLQDSPPWNRASACES